MSQPSPLTAAQAHAQGQASAGDLAGARLTLEQAMDAGRANLGDDDPAVLAVAHQLATVLQRGNDFSGARRVLEEAFAAGQWRLGDADSLMLAISFDLGIVAEELGNRHEARRAFGRVAAHGPQVLGNEHWAVTQARAYLGEDPPTVRMTLDRPVEELPRQTPSQPTPPPMPVQRFGSDVGLRHPEAMTGHPEATNRYPETTGVPHQDASWDERHASQRQTIAGRGAYRRGRGPVVFAAIAACLAAMVAVVALVVVLANRKPDDGAGVPTLGGNPPTDVRLRDLGSTVEVSWRDPTDGSVSFVVMGARTNEQLDAMARLGPGQTELKLDGLNARLDYCFVVVAVYSPDQVATSSQLCTSRDGASPAPTPSD